MIYAAPFVLWGMFAISFVSMCAARPGQSQCVFAFVTGSIFASALLTTLVVLTR